MAKNSIVISCLFTQSDIRNYYADTRSGMPTTMSGSLKSVWCFIAAIYDRLKKGMWESI
jgi:hypothetical protein